MVEKKNLTVATTTFYRPNSEADLLRAGLANKLIESTSEKGHQIIVVDGGSPDNILRKEFH